MIIRAILTKYTAMRNFLENMPGVVPLEYENIGVYMTDLLDAYMEWKTLWSQVNKSRKPRWSIHKKTVY